MPTRRRAGRLLAVLVPSLVLVLSAVAPAGAATTTTRAPAPTTAAPRGPVLPKAWLLLDVDTGKVLDAHDEHTLRRPASTIKLLTALTAKRHLAADADIPVSKLAAGMPARKMGLKVGDSWPLGDMLDSLIVVSANDAAVALAEAAGGTVPQFATQMAQTAHDLGVVDAPVLADPAGLDDNFSNGGGDWISAWDLAVIGTAARRDPQIAELASSPVVRFTDPSHHEHRLLNHNKLLGMYPGANGLKTGFTAAAGNTLVATATRNGRTMLVVVLDAADLYKPIMALFDKGFATPVAAEVGPKLEAHLLGDQAAATTTTAAPSAAPVARAAGSASTSTSSGRDTKEWLGLGVAALAVVAFELVRRRRRAAHR